VSKNEARRSAIARILWIILGLNLAVAAAKIAYGQMHGVLAISADGLHSLLDASSNVVGLVGAFLARRPPDWNHPTGIASTRRSPRSRSRLMLLGCREIAVGAFEHLRSPARRSSTPTRSRSCSSPWRSTCSW